MPSGFMMLRLTFEIGLRSNLLASLNPTPIPNACTAIDW